MASSGAEMRDADKHPTTHRAAPTLQVTLLKTLPLENDPPPLSPTHLQLNQTRRVWGIRQGTVLTEHTRKVPGQSVGIVRGLAIDRLQRFTSLAMASDSFFFFLLFYFLKNVYCYSITVVCIFSPSLHHLKSVEHDKQREPSGNPAPPRVYNMRWSATMKQGYKGEVNK